MNKKPSGRTYECIGGPLCGNKEAGYSKYNHGIPAFCYEDADKTCHFYRLAKHKGKRFWHYIGQGKIDKSAKPTLRPLS
jgi:hypothetical protein